MVNNMAAKEEDTTPLLAEEGGVRQRNKTQRENKKYEPSADSDWDPNLPYGGKVYLARKKKPDPWWVTALEVSMRFVSWEQTGDGSPVSVLMNKFFHYKSNKANVWVLNEYFEYLEK